MQFFTDTDVTSSQTPPQVRSVSTPPPAPKREIDERKYLLDNQTGQGQFNEHSGSKPMLDGFTGTTRSELEQAARGLLLLLPGLSIQLEYLDTTMEEYVPVPDDLTKMPQMAVVKVLNAPKVTRPSLKKPGSTQDLTGAASPTAPCNGMFSSIWASMFGGGNSVPRGKVAIWTHNKRMKKPTEWVTPNWSAASAQSGPVLISSSLRAVPGWLETNGKGTLSANNWSFNGELADYTQAHLKYLAMDESYGNMMDRLMTGGKLATLQVKVADTAKRIQRELESEGWPIKFDASSVEANTTPGNYLLAATRLTAKTNESDWKENGLDVRSKDNSYGGQFLTLTQDGQNMRMSTDAFHHPVAQYTIQVKGVPLTVRLTDITESPKQTPSMSELLASHLDPASFQSLAADGVEFPSIKVKLGNSVMERLLGAQNGPWQFIAAQASGLLQIHGQRPLYVDVAAVALAVFRGGGGPRAYDGYQRFYRIVDGQLQFNMLVELLVEDKVLLSCLANHTEHHRGSTQGESRW